MATMHERMIELTQNRRNAQRYAVYRNRLALFQMHGICAVPRYFTAANQKLTQYTPTPRPAINAWMAGDLYKWAKKKAREIL